MNYEEMRGSLIEEIVWYSSIVEELLREINEFRLVKGLRPLVLRNGELIEGDYEEIDYHRRTFGND